jgi:hypothetical protein
MLYHTQTNGRTVGTFLANPWCEMPKDLAIQDIKSSDGAPRHYTWAEAILYSSEQKAGSFFLRT